MTTYHVPHIGTTKADAENNSLWFCLNEADAKTLMAYFNAYTGDTAWTVHSLDNLIDNVPSLSTDTVDAPDIFYRASASDHLKAFGQELVDDIISNPSNYVSSSSGPTSAEPPAPPPP